MIAFWIVAAIAVGATGFPTIEDTRINGENGWYVPQIDGSFLWTTIEEAELMLNEHALIESRELSLNSVDFYLYTNSNSNKEKITASAEVITASNFDASNPTRFVIHGWNQFYTDSMFSDVRTAWLSRGNYNIILVDWARARSVEYITSVSAVPGAGVKVAAMINYLHTNHGMSLETLTVIGHSLGAHVAGYAGKNTQNGQIDTIIGLDPALPLFLYSQPSTRLASTDGVYVESIQTNGGGLGFLKPIGKGAFYPNGGESQPGCFLDLTGLCSHQRSVEYYAEAVEQNDFLTIQCGDYEEAVAKSCGSTYSSVRMGALTLADMVEGDFYVPINNKAPYGMAS